MPSSFFDATDDLPAVTFSTEMAKLLSASSYPHAQSHIRMDIDPEEQLYGGIVATSTSTEDERDQPRSKKRLRRSQTDKPNRGLKAQEAPKRQRGRPKVSTRDETAAERRRTQIRIAQRAYRNRKENTITELSQKVENLQATMRSINIEFMRLRESLWNAGLVHATSPVLEQVDELTKQLSEAIESSGSDNERTLEADDTSETQTQIMAQNRNQYAVVEGYKMPLDLQGQTHPVNFKPVTNRHSSLLEVGTDHNVRNLEGQNLTDFQSDPALLTNDPTFSTFKAGELQFHSHQVSSIDNLALASLERFPHKNLYTYSFQESTFTRRLHRLCIEQAFQKLLSPHVDPDWILRTFRLTFNFSNKERIIQGFKNILSRGTDEALENWRTPYIHIGGAGLHFPRKDATGRTIYPPNLLDPIRAAGTWRIPNTETVPPTNNMEEILQYVGFDGDWFDCHDVEEYLKTMGVLPEDQSSFLTVDRNLVNFLTPLQSEMETLTSSSSSSPRSHRVHQMGQDTQAHGSIDALNDTTQANQLSLQPEIVSSIDTPIDRWLDQQEAYTPNVFDIELQRSGFDNVAREARTLTIEVEKFLERLSAQSVCLGRAPGFRKEHVNKALVLALQEAF